MTFILIRPVRRLLSGNRKLYNSLKNIFGFYPENIFLYKLALRHKSQTIELKNGSKLNNERLEFLGDSVLSTVTSDLLFKMFPYKDEGFLTEMRSRLVSRSQLNKLSQKLGIDKLVIATKEGNNASKSINGDAFEALCGAIYLDKGYNFTRNILIENIINRHFDLKEIENTNTNYKSTLIEWTQHEKKPVEFVLVRESNGNGKQYVVNVLVDNQVLGTGYDCSIKGAEQDAAMKALSCIEYK